MVGNEKFQDLLQLRAGNSLVFVIDTTSSMGKDLAAVQQKTAEIVKETAGTPNAPYNYILVTFNDPGRGCGVFILLFCQSQSQFRLSRKRLCLSAPDNKTGTI